MAATKDTWFAGIAAVALHLVIALALVFGLSLRRDAAPIAGNIVEAVMIENYGEAIQPLSLPPEPEPEPVPEPEPDAAALEAEQQAQAAEEAARVALEREQAEIAERLERENEAREQAETQARLRREAEAAEQARQEEAARKAAADAERERVAKEAREKAAEEARRKAEVAARKQEEQKAALERARKAQAERDQKAREAELQAALAAEEQRQQAVDAGLLAQYKLKIKQKIQRNWSPPPLSGPVTCELRVRQLITGDVANVDKVDCGGNSALERSLAAAANKASPFPQPDDDSLFDPILVFEFRSDE